MDYVALNHNTNNIYGLRYNSDKPIGGIRYYHPDKQPVQVNPETKKTEVTIQVPKIQTKLKSQVSSKLPEPKQVSSQSPQVKKVTYQDVKERILKDIEAEIIKDEDWQKIQGNNFKKTEELIIEEENKDYIVTIQGKEVNFTEQDIKKRRLSRKERKWLRKAQNYFLTAEEKGRKIGSAESYTSMDILEALWRTAEEVDINPKRFIVQMYNETRFNPNLKGIAGERGLGQFKKSTAKYHGYDWKQMTNGTKGYAYQAKAAAEFVKQVGEVAYNGGSNGKAEKYHDKISQRMNRIDDSDSSCVMKTEAYCSSAS